MYFAFLRSPLGYHDTFVCCVIFFFYLNKFIHLKGILCKTMWPALWFCKNCHWIWEACLQETYNLIITVNNSFWGLQFSPMLCRQLWKSWVTQEVVLLLQSKIEWKWYIQIEKMVKQGIPMHQNELFAFVRGQPKDDRNPRLIWLKADAKRKVKFRKVLRSTSPSWNFFPRNILLRKGGGGKMNVHSFWPIA